MISIKYAVFTTTVNKHLIQTLHQTILFKSVTLAFDELEPVTLLLLYVYHDHTLVHPFIHLQHHSLSETECSCTSSWESDSCSSIFSLLLSYVSAEVVVCLPTSHRHPMLLDQTEYIHKYIYAHLKLFGLKSLNYASLLLTFLNNFPCKYFWDTRHGNHHILGDWWSCYGLNQLGNCF